mmetsp:Transcript_8087/g.34031  ORF Transcript_8087/g.34031 Transcript_8087/m.34031 type:complete len:219 (-) Transcript_8087:312-968(-)
MTQRLLTYVSSVASSSSWTRWRYLVSFMRCLAILLALTVRQTDCMRTSLRRRSSASLRSRSSSSRFRCAFISILWSSSSKSSSGPARSSSLSAFVTSEARASLTTLSELAVSVMRCRTEACTESFTQSISSSSNAAQNFATISPAGISLDLMTVWSSLVPDLPFLRLERERMLLESFLPGRAAALPFLGEITSSSFGASAASPLMSEETSSTETTVNS